MIKLTNNPNMSLKALELVAERFKALSEPIDYVSYKNYIKEK